MSSNPILSSIPYFDLILIILLLFLEIPGVIDASLAQKRVLAVVVFHVYIIYIVVMMDVLLQPGQELKGVIKESPYWN